MGAVAAMDGAEVEVDGLAAAYARDYVPLVRLAHLLTGSNQVAEELVQDCFVRVLSRWRGIENLSAYLRTSVVHAARSWHRRQRLALTHRPEPVAASFTPEVQEMADALRTLSARQRAAVVLRYYADMSEAEIARQLGCRPGTVKSLLSRALSLLREELKDA